LNEISKFEFQIAFGGVVWGTMLGRGVHRKRQHARRPPVGMSDTFIERHLGDVVGEVLRIGTTRLYVHNDLQTKNSRTS
jgi:hypothetical protein